MRTIAHWLYRGLALLLLACVVVEFLLAGLGTFRTQLAATGLGTNLTTTAFDHDFQPHVLLGYSLFGLSLLLIIATLLARRGRRDLLTAVGIVVLLAIQGALASSGPAGVRALHPVVGLLVLGAAVHLTLRAVRVQRGTVPAAERGRTGE